MEKICRNDLFVHDMIHNNPGLAPYESNYRDPAFLAQRGYDGKVFDLFDCAQFGLLFDALSEKTGKEKVFPENSEARAWVLKRREELQEEYEKTKQAGLHVCFMMDIIVLPKRMMELYPEILNEDGNIDIQKPKMREIMDVLFEEMFDVFPQIDGIYIRYGETYVGEEFKTPWHKGNNPIQGDMWEYHKYLIDYLMETVCEKYGREIYYRTWGFGELQYDRDTYLKLSDQIPVHDKFYFCIKHTTGDFHRTSVFNQSLNVGKHKQIVEIQAAREYEGKGAYPDYIANGVIHGFEEYLWQMDLSKDQCLADVVNTENSLIAGIWTWSRGGGWDGPYITGKNGKDGLVEVSEGKELWADVNAYVISHWAKDTSRSDQVYAMEYAREILGMDERDAAIFYEICLLSARAVLLGRACNTPLYQEEVFFTRDQNIEYAKVLQTIHSAMDAGVSDLLLYEQKRSVMVWKDMCQLASMLSESCGVKDYIETTCHYGYCLYAIYEQIYKGNVFAVQGGKKEEVKACMKRYEELWNEWETLYQTSKGCPTLFAKKDEIQELIGYNWNRGLDSAINPLRNLDENGKLKAEWLFGKDGTEKWGLK